MAEQKDLILSQKQILHKIKRIAFEIYENNFTEKEIVIAGIADGGYRLSRLLINELKKIADFNIVLVKVTVDKKASLKSKIDVDRDVKSFKGKTVILIDDVLHTGRTFVQSMKPFLEVNVKKIQTAVLINRSHSMFPITSNYTGYELSTTLNDHILVDLSSDEFGVYLY